MKPGRKLIGRIGVVDGRSLTLTQVDDGRVEVDDTPLLDEVIAELAEIEEDNTWRAGPYAVEIASCCAGARAVIDNGDSTMGLVYTREARVFLLMTKERPRAVTEAARRAQAAKAARDARGSKAFAKAVERAPGSSLATRVRVTLARHARKAWARLTDEQQRRRVQAGIRRYYRHRPPPKL
jgi:hypothetical protein